MNLQIPPCKLHVQSCKLQSTARVQGSYIKSMVRSRSLQGGYNRYTVVTVGISSESAHCFDSDLQAVACRRSLQGGLSRARRTALLAPLPLFNPHS